MQNLTHFLKSMLAFSMLFLFGQQALLAQQTPIQRSHAISEPDPGHLQSRRPATGVLNVVAIMVEFQPDTNRLTSGTGVFGENGMDGLPFMRNAEDIRIDPLPHDQNYFEAHLEFAKNYYEQSSDGKLTLDYRVLPEVYRLPKQMQEYSPTGETFTNEKVAELARDAWQKVEENGGFDASGLNPENTAFIIFHAGVGRDIELTGTSLDITPYDIPSLYLRKDNLRNLLDEPAFGGFPINGGDFQVTNSMILPRTESRRGLDIQDDEFVFSLSINGLLAASIGSHLGLPDLFDTETGDPAIGRFGLMDGAGFFAYNGLLPPEPSAWEKIYLGWETPFTINTDTPGDILLPAGSLSEPNSIAKYELSGSEYFLIENRHRDPDGTGLTLTIRQPDGTEVQQTFTNIDSNFVFQHADFDTLLEAGTFVNADNFDFSLPGGLDTGEKADDPSDDRNLNGGILIWHIDEAMIESQLSRDRVNADRHRRGVDLEEADGAQDIGPGIPGSLDNSTAFGTPFDFWWAGNNYTVIFEDKSRISLYENRFGPDTYPDNRSNSGAPSFFEFYDFSENLTTASFKIRPAQTENEFYSPGFSIQLSDTLDYFTSPDFYYDYYPLSLSVYETPSDTFLVIPSQGGIMAVNIADPENEQYQLSAISVQQPFIGDEELILAGKPGAASDDIPVISIQWNENSSTFDTKWTAALPANKGFISSADGQTLHADFTNSGLSIDDGNAVTIDSENFQRSETIGGEFAEASSSGVSFSSLPGFNFTPETSLNRLYSGAIQIGNRTAFYVFEEDRFSIIDPTSDFIEIPLFAETAAEWPAFLDNASVLRIDKLNNRLIGQNKLSATQNFTPVNAPDGVRFIGTPLYTDLVSSGSEYAMLVTGQDSLSINIYAYRQDGTLLDGFPLYVGKAVTALTQPVHPIIYDGKLFAVGHRGTVKSWSLTNVTDTKWGSRYGNARYNKVSARVGDTSESQSPSCGVLNGEETYNWPNPATEETNIRFEVAPPGGTIEITVITMGGRIIFEEKLTSPGGFPQELSVTTRHWGSGGYIARVKATVEGKTETKLIKIGVVH